MDAGTPDLQALAIQIVGNAPVLGLGWIWLNSLKSRDEKNQKEAEEREARLVAALEKSTDFNRDTLLVALRDNTKAMDNLTGAVNRDRCRAGEFRTTPPPISSDMTLQRT